MNKRDFYKWAMRLAFPIMVQNLISTLVGTADTVMLGYVSQNAMSASSLANQFLFLLFCFYYGLGTGASVLAAQYWGKGDTKTIERILGISESVSFLISMVFFMIGFFFPRQVMMLFSESPETIALGTEYLRIVSISFVFMGFAQTYLSTLRSVELVVFPTVTYIVSLCVNILLNATFIFGLFGAPKLGIVGVAIGTVSARVVETLMCIVHSYTNRIVHLRIGNMFFSISALVKDYLKVSMPAIGNDMIWGLAATMFSVIMGHMGDDMVAANAVAATVVNIGAIALRGFCSATTVIIGKTLGENNLAATRIYADWMLKMTIALGLVGCVVILALRYPIMAFYSDKLTETAISYLGSMMIMTTWRLVGEGINTCLICGCFRGGGDTRFGMITDTVFMWLVALPIMALAAYVFHLSVEWVYFCMCLDEFEKMPVVFVHYKRYTWMKNITREQTA